MINMKMPSQEPGLLGDPGMPMFDVIGVDCTAPQTTTQSELKMGIYISYAITNSKPFITNELNNNI